LGRKALRVVLIEGKNREIRRVFSHFHLHPQRLHRIRIGPIRLGILEEGKSRPLTEREMELLPRGATKDEGVPHGHRYGRSRGIRKKYHRQTFG
jgi:23S rRNA pseudouridine2605 synthase